MWEQNDNKRLSYLPYMICKGKQRWPRKHAKSLHPDQIQPFRNQFKMDTGGYRIQKAPASTKTHV